jgi:ethanolamine utilization protein EutA
LLAELGLNRQPGDELMPNDISRVLDFYVGTLEAVVNDDREVLQRDLVACHRQLAFRRPHDAATVITLSGGVGELVYRCHRGEELGPTTVYGDLGIDLARRIAASPILSRDLGTCVPTELGRATVCGLAIHATEVSGNTLFLPRPERLPLTDLPIVGRLRGDLRDDEIAALVALASGGHRGACLTVDDLSADYPTVVSFGRRIAVALEERGFPPDKPLVLLVAGNIGKTLGHYATRWGKSPVELIVIDEIAPRDARFASLGRLRDGIVPVSLYGMNPMEDEGAVSEE